MLAIDTRAAAEACRIEHEILGHVRRALGVTLNWQAPQASLAQKLSSVRFTLGSFQRHLERMMQLEESGGYLGIIAESKPNLTEQSDVLRREHKYFRDEFLRLSRVLDDLSPEESVAIEESCDEIRHLLDAIAKHDRREIELLQRAFCDDEGGEG